jgi:hypothetical protein
LPRRLCWRDSCTWIFLVELGFDDSPFWIVGVFVPTLRDGYSFVLVLHLELIYEVSNCPHFVSFSDFNFSYICSLCFAIYSHLCLVDWI